VEFLGLESSAFPALFRLLAAEEGANISRIDIACDDREGYLNMDEIVQKIQSNQVKSRMAKRSVTISYDGVRRGGTKVYLGAPSSDFRVRIYDKAKQEGIDGRWLRVELVMRHKNSAAFVFQAVICESVDRLAPLWRCSSVLWSWPGTPESGFQISKKRSFHTIIISNFPVFAPGDFVMPFLQSAVLRLR